MAKNSGDRVSNSVRQGAEIESMLYKNKAALPKKGDVYAQTFADIGKSFSAPGDRPRGILRNIGAGLAKGAETGAKLNSLEEREGDFGEYANVMNYFQDVNNSAIEQNQWHENRERQLETIKPFAIGGLEVSYSGMDYGTGNERMRNIMEQAKIADPSIKGDYVGYIPNTPIVNMRDAEGNITTFSLSSVVGEDVVKRVQGNFIDQQKINNDSGYRQTDLDIKKYKAGIKGGQFGEGLTSSEDNYGSIPVKTLGGKGMTPFMNTISSEMNLAKEVPTIVHQIDQAQDIINKNPALGKTWSNLVGGSSIAKNALSDETRAAYEKVDKIADRVAEAFIRAKGSAISDAERATIKSGLFKVTNSAAGNKYNINSVKQELMLAKERGEFAAEELAKGYIATPKSFEKYKKSLEESSGIENGGGDIWNQLGAPSQ